TEFAFVGRQAMRMRSKSPTTTSGQAADRARTCRLPRARPPTHPGEMLLEEFLVPLGITQSALAVRLAISFPRLNEIVRGKRGGPATAYPAAAAARRCLSAGRTGGDLRAQLR